MADDTVKRLLIKLGISTTEWKQAVQEIKTKLSEVNTQAKRDALEMKATQKEQIGLTRQQIDDQKRLAAESRSLAEFDKAKAAWQRQQQEALKTKLAQRILETAEVKKQGVQQQISLKIEQEALRIVQQKFKLQQQQTREQQRTQAASTGGGGRGIVGGVLGGMAGMLGGGPLGMIAAGVSGGEILTQGLEKIVEHFRELGKSLMEATGPATQLREQFEKLTARQGVEPDEYLNKLRAATRGLAQDTALYRIANNYMQQGLKVTDDQIVRLVSATVNLARAQGKDATVAMQALERASKTGQTRILSMVTGLTRQELQLKGVSQAMDATTRNTMQFTKVLEALEAREKAIGTPATTLPELFKQWSVAQKNLTDDMAMSIARSTGYKNTIEGISKAIIELQPKISELVIWIGKQFGDALAIVTPALTLFGSALHLLSAEVKAWGSIIDTISGMHKSLNEIPTKTSSFRKWIGDMSIGFLTLAEYVNITAIRIAHVGDIISGVITRNYGAAATAYQQMKKEIEESKQEYLASVDKAVKFGYFPDDTTAAASNQKSGGANATLQKQLQKLDLQYAKEAAQLKLEFALEGLKRQEAETKKMYEQGVIDLEAQVAKEKIIRAQEHGAKLIQIEEERKATVNEIVKSGKDAGTPQVAINKQVRNENEKARLSVEKENTSFGQQFDALDNKVLQDKEAAYISHVDKLNKLAQEGVQERLIILEKEFKQGRVEAEDYITQRRALIEEEYKVTVDGLNKKLDVQKKNAKDREAIEDAIAQAGFQRDKKNTGLDLETEDIKVKYLDQRYQQEKKLIELETASSRFGKKTGTGGSETAQDEALLQLTENHINELIQKEIELGAVTDKNYDAWIKVKEGIAQATLEAQKLNQQIAQAKDISRPIGGIFGGLSGLAGSFGGSAAQQLSQTLGGIQSSSADISKFNVQSSTLGGPGKLFQNIGSTFKGLFGNQDTKEVPRVDSTGKPVLDEFGKQMKDIVKIPFAEKLTNFGGALDGVISGVGGLVKGVTGGKSAAGGALGGGMAGMQFGAQFGPWGALAGGVGGAVMGGIFGSKQASLDQDLKKITNQMQGILDSMTAGTITMGQAIQDLRRERQAAIQMLSQNPKSNKSSGGKKGGGKKGGMTPTQAQGMIEQIDTQIKKLIDTQKILLDSMHQSLIELSQPMQFQPYLQSLDQIIQKYQQFASAASGNAQEVALANQYLNDSLQNYVTTLDQQLNQAQQTAIQDALTLINLEYQRQQIINQEAQQEYDILSQGVLTRQRTTAMTKGQEIGQLRYQRDMQLQQINEQISLQQFKVDQETKIFGLATTRIGLEYQLLAAQESAAGVQISQIQALQQVANLLGQGLSSGQLMQQISSMYTGGVMPTGTGIMSIIAQLLGLSGNVPSTVTSGQFGSQNWLTLVPQPYQSAADYMNAMDPNFYNLLMAAVKAGPGSPAAQATASDVSQYASQGTVEGYDMAGLTAWLTSGAAGAGSGGGGGGGNGGGHHGYSEGGPVRETGPIYAHAGEWVLPKPVVGVLQAMNSVGKFGSSLFGQRTGGSGTVTSTTFGPKGTIQGPIDTSSLRLGVESQIHSMTNARIGAEMQIISARSSLIDSEMAYLMELKQTVKDMHNITVGGSSNLEAMLQKVYETRGRYGSATFRRGTL